MQTKDKKIRNFRLIIVDDETHRHIRSVRFTKNGIIVFGVSAAVIIFLVIYALVAFTPIRTFIPGYPDAVTKRAAIQNAMKVDSLEMIVSRWALYSENLKRIFEGEEPVRIDSLLKNAGPMSKTDFQKEAFRQQDSVLRSSIAEEEQFSISAGDTRDLRIEGMHFFVPVKGVVSLGYDKVSHPYIDITAPANTVVKAVLDGTVIYAGWNDESGYSIALQHDNDIVSIYKHNQKLLKKAGDKVTAGSSIALLGNTGSLSTGDHLHFELWYKGEAVNPAKYINF